MNQRLSLEELTERFYFVRDQRNRLLWASRKALDAFDAANRDGKGTWSGKDVDEMRMAVAAASAIYQSGLPHVVQQRDDEAWMHAACLTIAETGQKWGDNVHPSPAMKAVYELRQRLDWFEQAAKEARAALFGCREALGSIGNIDHAIDLLNKAMRHDEDPPEPDSCCECGELAAGYDEGSPYCAAHYRSRPSVHDAMTKEKRRAAADEQAYSDLAASGGIVDAP